MARTTSDRVAAVCRAVGLALLVGTPVFAAGKEYTARREADVAARIRTGGIREQATAVMNAVEARRDLAHRWDAGGHATLGAVGALVGAALLAAGRRRRA
jgi:hypothetical protein